MARARGQTNGRLEEAMATLLQTQTTLAQNQAILVQNQAAFQAQAAEASRRAAETDRRLIELEREIAARFARIEAMLLEHHRILQALPDAIREKIGFKTPEQS
jgi:hypothetical protein